jgi:adenylate kinase family enzyme
MKRIAIIGPCGAGKTTLAMQLSKKLQLPVIHLDMHFWQPGWQETAHPIWEEKVKVLANQEQWIIDGNFIRTMDIRLQAADTIIFLNRSRWRCLWRVFRRWLNAHKQVRPDMAAGCPERLNWQLFLEIWNYPTTRKARVLEKLKHYAKEKPVYIFTNDKQIKNFLHTKINKIRSLD